MKEQFISTDEHGNRLYYSDKSMTVLHREDGPAIVSANGFKAWYIGGNRHREDGPAIEYTNGCKEWYIDGNCHREDGPAIEYSDGCKEWYINGKRHREDGPAVEDVDGFKEWYIDGKRLTEDEFNDRNKVGFTYDDKELIIKCIEGAIIAATEPCEKDNPMYISHTVCKIYDLKILIRRIREYL